MNPSTLARATYVARLALPFLAFPVALLVAYSLPFVPGLVAGLAVELVAILAAGVTDDVTSPVRRPRPHHASR